MILFNPQLEGQGGGHTFLKSICLKVSVIARLVFELAYYDAAEQLFNHYTTKHLSSLLDYFVFLFSSYYRILLFISIYIYIYMYVYM